MSRPVELGEEIIDFLSDQNGPTAKVSKPKTVEKANVTTSDIELLRRSFLPDRFKFDVALRALLAMEAPPTPPPKKPEPVKKEHKKPPSAPVLPKKTQAEKL